MTHELTTLPNLRRLWTYVKTTANGVDGSYETARVNERVGIPRIEFFFGIFYVGQKLPQNVGFFMFCHLLDRSFDWVDSCMFRTILESVMVLRTRSWWGKKNEEKPRIQQRFFSFVHWGHWEKVNLQRLRKMCLFLGGRFTLNLWETKHITEVPAGVDTSWGMYRQSMPAPFGPTQKWMGFQRGKPKHQQRWVLGLGIQDQSPSDLSYNR